MSDSGRPFPLCAEDADENLDTTTDPHGPQRCQADRDELPTEAHPDLIDAALAHADEAHGGHLCVVLGNAYDDHCPAF